MHFNKWLLGGACTLLVIALAAVTLLHAATPIIGALSANPAYIVMNTPTDVVFTVQITDPSLIAASVNLLKIDSNGKTLSTVGVMHDDGTSGDVVAGDRLFSYRVSLNESSAGTAYYQASAAFKGVLQRIRSTLSMVTVVQPIGAPNLLPRTLAPGKGILTARVTIPRLSQRPSVTIVSINTPGFSPVELLDNGIQPDENANDATFSGWVPIEGSPGVRIELRASVKFPNADTTILTPGAEVQFATTTEAAQGSIGVDGGIITAGAGRLSFSVPPNSVTGPITFVISETKHNELPAYIPASILVRGGIEIEPDAISEASDADLTDTFNAHVVMPLYDPLTPASTLRVVYYDPSSKSLYDADTQAIVGEDGSTASFTTKQIGLFLLIQ